MGTVAVREKGWLCDTRYGNYQRRRHGNFFLHGWIDDRQDIRRIRCFAEQRFYLGVHLEDWRGRNCSNAATEKRSSNIATRDSKGVRTQDNGGGYAGVHLSN